MKILAIGAHLDDIEIACGGTLAKAVEAGHEVKVLVMTRSGYTNKEGKVQRSNELAVIEGTNALHALGVQDIEILDFETKDVPYRSDVVNAIDICISDYQPDVIFTHHPFDTHQAHEAVAKSTISAARRMNTVFFYEPIMPSGRSYVAFKPDLYVDIENTLQKKIDAMKCHVSEYEKFGAEHWVEGIKARCRFRGYEIGKDYAEAFEVLRIEMSFDENCKLL